MVEKTLYNSIGQGYNLTRCADPYLLDRICFLLEPKAESKYLDIGCGTGNYTAALAGKGFQLAGVDPSDLMLKEAMEKSNKVNWLKGTAEKIPVGDNYFDGAIATLTLHHWQHKENGFKELNRVLKSDSRIVFLTSTPSQMKGYWLNHYFPRLIDASGKNMPSVEETEKAAGLAGFELIKRENYFVKPDLKDLFLHSGKHDPELYFNESVRKGISTFAALSNKAEVDAGLAQLRNDIDSGKFEEVKANYETADGDYCFLVFRKI